MKIPKPNRTFVFCLCTLLIVFIFFFPTLFYSLKTYDELVPLNEDYLPTCLSLSEMFEIISLLGLNNYFEAANTLYSNIISLRSNPAGNLLQMLVQFFLRKNPVSYHLYTLVLHLISTTILFLLINKVSNNFLNNDLKTKNGIKLLIVSLLTLIWAIHPVNLESVLLLSNANSVLSHALCFLTAFIYLNSNNQSILKSISLFLLYSMALFTTEFHFVLPLILISYTTAVNLNSKNKTIMKCFTSAVKENIPIVFAAFLFVASFLFSTTRINLGSTDLQLTLERVFWLSPQILFHFTKLFFFPLKLAIDQSFFVTFGKSLFDPYAIFCFIFILLVLIFSIFSLIRAKKHFPFFFVSFFLFYVSLIPFSHILAPSYNIASERYLYFPSFILIFGLSHFVFSLITQNKMVIYSTICILVVLFSAYLSRSYIRSYDWKDGMSFYKSIIRETDNPLYKAFRYKTLTPQENIFSEFPEDEVPLRYKKLAVKNAKKAIKLLKREKSNTQSRIPKIIKYYGLDPETLLSKAAYILAQVDFRIYKDPKKSLELIEKYVKNPSLLNIDGLTFYSSLYFHNNLLDKTEEILKIALEKDPYSLRALFITADLADIKSVDLREIEKYALVAFKYFPYDTKSLLLLTKIYYAMGNFEKYADFSYIYGVRIHSIQDLKNALNTYILLNKKDKAEKTRKKIEFLERKIAEFRRGG